MSHTEQDLFASFMTGFGLHFHLRKSNIMHKTASGRERWVEMTSKSALRNCGWRSHLSFLQRQASKMHVVPMWVHSPSTLKLLPWYCRPEHYEIEHYLTDICPRGSDYSSAYCKTLLWPACGWMAWEASITKVISGPEGWFLNPQTVPMWHN